ncbi:MAG: hypothetical protein GQ540_03500 [Lutibacter sp.]|uniref:terminase small subunit n=1 Tax=Lutibacter sp. TaxID=1925666 RepID=UPI0019F0899E|nr:terminase small subunit [Lutibacter sp.]NOR27578.1 hypothetical protein [Lutibacter sp.]
MPKEIYKEGVAELLSSDNDIEEFVRIKEQLDSVKTLDDLTPQMRRFTQEYVIDYKPSEAAKRAGVDPWYRNAYAAKALKNKIVQQSIRSLEEITSINLAITKERTLQEFSKISFSNIQDLFDENGKLKDIASLDRDTAASIESIQVDKRFEGHGEDIEEVEVTKVKFHSKIKALNSLAKYFGIYEKDKERKVNMSFADFLKSLPKEVREEIRFALMKRIGNT